MKIKTFIILTSVLFFFCKEAYTQSIKEAVKTALDNNESLKILARYDENGDYVYNQEDKDENEIENEL